MKSLSLIDQFIASPLDQFEVRDLLSLDAPILANLHFSITNIGLYITIAALITLALNILAVNQTNAKRGQIYFPFIFALFIFILINNLIGIIPYSFASTSHFILTYSISFTVVAAATILGLIKHGLRFFSLFVPAGCPLGLLPLLVLIEFISYLARNISLGLRLAINIIKSAFALTYAFLELRLSSLPRPHSFVSLLVQSNNILKLKWIFINLISILTLIYKIILLMFTKKNIIILFKTIISLFTVKSILSIIKKMWNNKTMLGFLLFISLSHRSLPHHVAISNNCSYVEYYYIPFGLIYAVLRLLVKNWKSFHNFSFKAFILDIVKGIILYKLASLILLTIIILHDTWPYFSPSLFKEINYCFSNNTEYRTILNKISLHYTHIASPIDDYEDKFNSRVMVDWDVSRSPTPDRGNAGAADVTIENPLIAGNMTVYVTERDFIEGVSGQQNYARLPADKWEDERINNRYGRRNAGFFGGTQDTINDWTTFYIADSSNWIGRSYNMLTSHCNFWNYMRSFYPMPEEGLERHLPRITHVPIQGGRPHETGIMVHLIRGNVHYSALEIDEAKLAKIHIDQLVDTYADNLTEARRLHGEGKSEYNIAELAKATHEFRAIVHHYQLYFLYRNARDFTYIVH